MSEIEKRTELGDDELNEVAGGRIVSAANVGGGTYGGRKKKVGVPTVKVEASVTSKKKIQTKMKAHNSI